MGGVSCFMLGTYEDLTALTKVIQVSFAKANNTLLIGK